jgi:ABC-type nitrate/sulfonate/bicarbonate transport system ATPase subunit
MLGGFGDRYPYELSGGMRQRLALARVLAAEPSCMLLDEPLAALDSQHRRMMQDELVKLWRDHDRTIVMVTHDLDEAVFLAGRSSCFPSAHPRYARSCRSTFRLHARSEAAHRRGFASASSTYGSSCERECAGAQSRSAIFECGATSLRRWY